MSPHPVTKFVRVTNIKHSYVSIATDGVLSYIHRSPDILIVVILTLPTNDIVYGKM